MANKKTQKTDASGSEEEKNKNRLSNDVKKKINKENNKGKIDQVAGINYYPEWSKKMPNITAVWSPTYTPLKSTIVDSSSLLDSMRSITAISDIYRPAFIGTTIPDYSKIGIMSNSTNLLGSLSNPIAGFDIPKSINLANDKSYENLRDFNYSTNSKINELTKKLNDTLSQLKELKNKHKSLEETTIESKSLLEQISSLTEELDTLKGKGHIISRIYNLHISSL